MRLSPLFRSLMVAGLLLPVPALAQNAAPQAGAPTQPTDVKPIGDWTVRCFPVASSSPCDMYEEMDNKDTRQRVVGVSIAYGPAADNYVAQIAVPLGISVQAGAILKTDTYTSPKLAYRRCDRDGCYVEMIMPKEMVDQLSRSAPNASLNIVADNGKTFALRVSLNGFAAANDAMSNLAKEKVAKSGPAAAAAGPRK